MCKKLLNNILLYYQYKQFYQGGFQMDISMTRLHQRRALTDAQWQRLAVKSRLVIKTLNE